MISLGPKGNWVIYTRLMTVKERIKGIGGLPTEDNEKADIGCNLKYVSPPKDIKGKGSTKSISGTKC